jgi:hypothetical protein
MGLLRKRGLVSLLKPAKEDTEKAIADTSFGGADPPDYTQAARSFSGGTKSSAL